MQSRDIKTRFSQKQNGISGLLIKKKYGLSTDKTKHSKEEEKRNLHSKKVLLLTNTFGKLVLILTNTLRSRNKCMKN